MDSEQIRNDVAIAERICEDLRAGNRKALTELYNAHHHLFLNFAKLHLYNPEDFEDVTQNFWAEIMNGKAICAYAQNPKNTATLRTYLVGMLYRRIIDANRKTSRYKEIHQKEENLQEIPDQAPPPNNVLVDSISQDLARRLVHQALLKLSEESPQDASLVGMHLEGLDYSQMAIRTGKRIDAIKKQFTRERTGSLAKFKRALKFIMQAQGLTYEDI
jgi:RNA polymerase sigma factor (sigma-70 family)